MSDCQVFGLALATSIHLGLGLLGVAACSLHACTLLPSLSRLYIDRHIDYVTKLLLQVCIISNWTTSSPSLQFLSV